MIAPFERLFAEGYIYRQASERPRKLVVVLGVWLIFGTMALVGLMFIALSPGSGVGATVTGVLTGSAVILFSLTMIWKSTRNYLARKNNDEGSDA
jgi:membrane associated rhomboid family serine protease